MSETLEVAPPYPEDIDAVTLLPRKRPHGCVKLRYNIAVNFSSLSDHVRSEAPSPHVSKRYHIDGSLALSERSSPSPYFPQWLTSGGGRSRSSGEMQPLPASVPCVRDEARDNFELQLQKVSILLWRLQASRSHQRSSRWMVVASENARSWGWSARCCTSGQSTYCRGVRKRSGSRCKVYACVVTVVPCGMK